jgi:ribonuclease-3
LRDDHPWGRTGNSDRLAHIADELGYPADDYGHLIVATTHKSFANEAVAKILHNERLEFLGDAVLDLIVADALMGAHPNVSEGELSRHRAALVSSRSLAEVAQTLDLGSVLRLGRGEELSGGRSKESLLADAFEAVVGAAYLDHGLEAVRVFVLRHFGVRIEAEDVRVDDRDFKTALQEYAQKKYQEAPSYTVLTEVGPDHAKAFTVGVSINGVLLAQGTGRSKKHAERAAAGTALKQMESKD